MRAGEYSAAMALLSRAAGEPSGSDDAYLKALALAYLGRLALAWGEYEQAREPLDRALAIIARVRPRAAVMPLVARAQLARAEGDRGLARELLGEALALAREGGEGAPRALLGMASLCLDEGDQVVASDLYEEALDLARAGGAPDQAAEALDGLAHVARIGGASTQAASYRREALLLRHERRTARGPSEPLEVTAHLGTPTESVAHAARLVGAANALREAGAAADMEAGAAGDESVGSLVEEGWESLTAREREVAELVAEGLTNKAIAERLVIAPATVKTHLEHVFPKLGIATRSELTREIWRRGGTAAADEPDAEDPANA